MALSKVAVDAAASTPAPRPQAVPSLPTTLPGHPRIGVTDEQLGELLDLIDSDATPSAYYAAVRASATDMLAQPPIPYINCTVAGACRGPLFPAGDYLDAGAAAGRIKTLALVHRLDAANGTRSCERRRNGHLGAAGCGGGPSAPSRWSKRAVEEMVAVAAFPSWQWPVAQALEHGILSHGVALGYDWLYDAMEAADKATVLRALTELGLRTHQHSLNEGLWWTQDIYNWVLVSNGGMLAAAIAVADESGAFALANDVFGRSLVAMGRALPSFAPDGVWPEGPGYWGFAMEFVVNAATAMTTALGHDFGVMESPGLAAAGLYDTHMTGPSYTYFNWADCHPQANAPSTLFYLSKRFDLPVLAAVARDRIVGRRLKGDVDSLIHYNPVGSPADIAALPLNVAWSDPNPDTAYGRKKHVGFLRSSWAANATWVGFKGGENHFNDHGSDSHNNHGHLDAGNFVLEMRGVRWIIDLGSGEYDYPLISYFGRFRFSYYVTNSHGHNVLSFDGESQDRFGSAAIEATQLNGSQPSAVVNGTAAYARGGATAVLRNISMHGDGANVLVADQWVHKTAQQVTWKVHTVANITLSADASVATLSMGGQTLRATVKAPAGAQFRHAALALDPPQVNTYSDGRLVRVLSVAVPASVGGVSVQFS